MVNIKFGVWKFVAGALPLLIFGCASPAERSDESVGVSRQAVVGALSKRFSISLPRGVSIADEPVAAGRTLTLADRARVQASAGTLLPIANSGTSSGGVTQLGNDAKSGTILSKPGVTLGARARVEGNVQSGGSILPGSQTVVTGNSTPNSSPIFDPWSWTVNFPAASQSVTVPQAGTTSLNPGSFENITVSPNATLKLKTGTYYLKSFDLEAQAQVLVDTTLGPVFIYIRGGLFWRGATNFTGPADRLLVGYAGADSIVVEAPFVGTLAAPDATVRLAVGATSHIGAFFAKNLQLDPDVKVTARPFSGWGAFAFDLVPTFECAQRAPDNSIVATFGYFNPNGQPVTLPLGSGNAFSMAPASRNQPTTFLTGAHLHSFSIAYSGAAPAWQLGGLSATIDASKTCSNSFSVTSVQDATLSFAAPNGNFGAATTLEVSAQKSSVVQFDRKALLAARGAGRLIARARLELDVSSAGGVIDAFAMRRRWDEQQATWTCAKDQDPAPATSSCKAIDQWQLEPRPHTHDNPYQVDRSVPAAPIGGKIVFDVTADVRRFASAEGGYSGPIGWLLRSRDGQSSTLFAREGGKAARLIIDALPFSDADLAGMDPFGFQVDTSLATTDTLTSLDGTARPVAVVQPSDSPVVRFAQNEMLLMTDDPALLAAFTSRWGATELMFPFPRAPIPGVATMHLMRIDTSRANTATLVPNLLEGVNRPDGIQKVSSTAGLGLLAAVAEEARRGSVVAINWLVPGAGVDVQSVNNSKLIDGPSLDPTEPSSNDYDWTHFALHEVPLAWELLLTTGHLKPTIKAAIVDMGFSPHYQDEKNTEIEDGLNLRNPFPCGGGTPCPWHGVYTASAGFGEPNNVRGGAGPGASVTKLKLFAGFGDMASVLFSVNYLAGIDDRKIINFSNSIPIPAWAAADTLGLVSGPAEVTLAVARDILGTLVIAAAGNAKTDVDEEQCFRVLGVKLCPYEKVDWFPCENAEVLCVGATNYGDKGADTSYTNYGDSVGYWASGAAIVGADPDRAADGDGFHVEYGTSFAAPFLSGIAALTWAAGPSQLRVGDVEDCLEAAKSGGPLGRFVDAYFATACGLGNPSNVGPLVQIINPGTETVDASGLGFVSLQGVARDHEDGIIHNIGWYDENNALVGTSTDLSTVLYAVTSSGLHTITAKVVDSDGATATDSVTLSASPAPPALLILAPRDPVFAGLPTDLAGKDTNFFKPGLSPPCSSSIWTGFSGSTQIFTNVNGCSNQATFAQAGAASVTWTMTVDGLTGTARQDFNVISDGKLHVTITNPLKDVLLDNNVLSFLIETGAATTLSAASTSDAQGGVAYAWSVQKVDFNNIDMLTNVASLTGQTPAYTPNGFACHESPIRLTVTATNQSGEVASDSIRGSVHRTCPVP